jgi:hypothetical protein
MLLDLFLIGLVVNVEPIPVSAMILLLAAERGVLKGAGFVLGWLATLVLIVAATVVATDGRPPAPASAPSTGAGTACAATPRRRAHRPPLPRHASSRSGWPASTA